MLRDMGFTYSHYLGDLEQYLNLMDELEHCLMSSRRRSELEQVKEVLEIVLGMYEVDWR